MHSTNPVVSAKPTVVQQLNIFGGFDEISVATSGVIRRSAPVAPAPAEIATPKAAARKQTVQAKPPRVSVPDEEAPAHEALLVDPDEPVDVDLESHYGDSPEMILAKRMFLRMMWDINGKADDVEPDLFGQTSTTSGKAGQAEQNRFDALIWLYGLNPDGALVSIEWVCDVLGFDPHRVRRIVGRSLRKELKRLVHLLSTIVGREHAQECEEKISDYLDISNWSFN